MSAVADYEYEEEEEGGTYGPVLSGMDGQEWRAGLALGFLAMLPMLIAYELSDSGSRSTAEMVLLRVLSLFGDLERTLRWTVIALMAGVAVVTLARTPSRRRDLLPGVGAALGRVAIEGTVLALLLGPALVGLMYLLGVQPPGLADPDQVPAGARAAFVFGAAAWEELLFRVGAYSALYLIVRRTLHLFRARDAIATGMAELCGLLGSAVLFAGAHLAVFTAWLGPGGELYDGSVFTWRLLAGILLGLVFRWRGPGVAAWTHGLFNLALLLGAGPDVFL